MFWGPHYRKHRNFDTREQAAEFSKGQRDRGFLTFVTDRDLTATEVFATVEAMRRMKR